MKKIKTINKLLSSLTLLSSLAGIVFNNKYENQQTVVTENNNALNNYFSINAEPVKMGDIYVNLDETGKIIQSYASGEGKLVVPNYITEVADYAFDGNISASSDKIISVDLSNATSLTRIGQWSFATQSKLSGEIIIPSSVTSIADSAFESIYGFAAELSINFSRARNLTNISYRAFANLKFTSSLDLSNATSLATIGGDAFAFCSNLAEDLVIPFNVTSIGNGAFYHVTLDNLYFLSETPPAFETATWKPTVTGKVYVPSEAAKEAYLAAPSFGFDSSQVEVLVSGETTINSQMNVAGSKQYTLNTEFNPTNWEIVMIESEQKPSWLSVDNDGLLSWTAQYTSGTYKFKIKATDETQNFVESPPITLKIYNSTIDGDQQIDTESSKAGSKQYTFNSTPWGLIPDQWEIIMTEGAKPDWLTIESNGLLSWTDQCVAGTYKFKIKATDNVLNVSLESSEITFNVTGHTPVPPEPTLEKSYISLILGLLIGLGIPVILAIAFIIWYATKKKETTVKIKKKK